MANLTPEEIRIIDAAGFGQYCIKHLSLQEVTVLYRMLDNYSVVEIANQLHASRRSITYIVASIRKKLRPFFSHPS